MARVILERMVGDGNNPAHVDADCGEDTAGADSATESLVECTSLRYGARIEYLSDDYAAMMFWMWSLIF